MNEYQVFARKLRPQTFGEVIAQHAIVATLKNAIRHKRTAHAYLFCGSKGTGKTTLARLFAKAVNCAHLTEDIEPCNNCPSCREIAHGHSIDVLEIDGASHRGIEDVRMINETIGFAPVGKHYKIYLIDEVHMLTKEAFNALLKTLEEPPAHVKFLFCTTEAHKIPATILSRCQRFHLLRIPPDKIVQKLAHIAEENKASITQEALELVAKMAEGSLRDALLLLEQLLSFESGAVTAESVQTVFGLPPKELFFSLAEAGEKNSIKTAFHVAEEIFSSGKNIAYFIEELTSHFRTLLLMKSGIEPRGQFVEQYKRANSYYNQEQLVHILEYCAETQTSIKSAPSVRTAIELLLLKILRTHRQMSFESLVERLIALEKRLSEETSAAPPKPEQTQQRVTPTGAPQEQSRFDTVMRFAAKELNGSLKKG